MYATKELWAKIKYRMKIFIDRWKIKRVSRKLAAIRDPFAEAGVCSVNYGGDPDDFCNVFEEGQAPVVTEGLKKQFVEDDEFFLSGDYLNGRTK